MIWTLIVFTAGLWIGSRFQPSLKIENNHLCFSYKNLNKIKTTKNLF